MRPALEVSTAVLEAARSLAYVDADGQRRGGTLAEVAEKARVGKVACRQTMITLRRASKLEQVADRKVTYRNRPVAEWAPTVAVAQSQGKAEADVARVVAMWAQR